MTQKKTEQISDLNPGDKFKTRDCPCTFRIVKGFTRAFKAHKPVLITPVWSLGCPLKDAVGRKLHYVGSAHSFTTDIPVKNVQRKKP